MNVTERLFELQDKAYADFHSGLVPNVPREKIIGVRVPDARRLAKEYGKDPECRDFLRALPHKYYDENVLHGILLSGLKDYEECVRAVEEFLPYVDNWAVCDILSPKVFRQHRTELIAKVREWSASEKPIPAGLGWRC